MRGNKPDPEELKRDRINRDPLTYCRWMTSRPGLWFGITLGGHLLLMSINFILIGADYNILPIEFEAFPIDIMDEITYRREHAWKHRNDGNETIVRYTVDDVGPTWPRGYSVDTLTLYYTISQGKNNVFQKKYLEQMQGIEDDIFSNSDYQTKFCQIDFSSNCMKPSSILRYFDGTYANISSVFYDPGFNNIEAVIYEANNNVETKDDFQYFLGKGYEITATKSVSHLTRTGLPFGWPLEGPESDDEKFEKIENFQVSTLAPILDDILGSTQDGLTMNYFSVIMFQDQVLPQALKDMMLAIGSLLFIFIIMWIQTKSLWITGFAVISIITSFWITNLIYRTIINYAYFGYFHIIAIFIVLGIGADDIFVFYNTWRATGHDAYPSLAHRMSDCYRRSAATMFFTSFTTMMAFLISGISPVLPIGSFGIFTGVLIGVNYISVIIFFPNVVLMHHVYFEKACCCCCSPSTPHNNTNPTKIDVCVGVPNNVVDPNSAEEEPNESSDKKKKRHLLVRFFAGPYFRFVTHKVVRWVIIVVFVAFLAFFIWSASRIESSTESVKVYRDNTNFGRAMSLEDEFVATGENHLVLYLVWGLEPTDTSDCHYTDWQCDVTNTYDDSFDMNTPPVQRALLNFCANLKYNLTLEEEERLSIGIDSRTGEREVDCFLDDMNEFLNLTYPLNQANMATFMAAYPTIYMPDELGADFYRYFEIGVSNWMTNRYTLKSQPDYFVYNHLIGEERDVPHTKEVNASATGIPGTYYGTKLRYATLQVNLTLNTRGLGYSEGLAVMGNWETFFNDQLEQMPNDLRGGFQVTNGTWHWLVIQQKLEQGAWLGITVGICIAFPVLVLATMNIIVGLYATILIACVTASVLGVIPLAGWKIDVMISMNLTLLVGLSVDYIVHLAEGYHLSDHSDRQERVRDMLQNLGISVIMGAVTTLGAALFMLFSKIMFFFQFGTFLFCIIGFSVAFSLVFFPAVMSIIGPEGETGSIKTPFIKLHYKRIGRAENDVTCGDCDGKGFKNPENIMLNGSDVKAGIFLNKPDKYTRNGDKNVCHNQTGDINMADCNGHVNAGFTSDDSGVTGDEIGRCLRDKSSTDYVVSGGISDSYILESKL